MEPKAASGPPWRGEISSKNSSGGLLQVTDEFFSAPEALQERFWDLLRRTSKIEAFRPPPRAAAGTSPANSRRQLLPRRYVVEAVIVSQREIYVPSLYGTHINGR